MAHFPVSDEVGVDNGVNAQKRQYRRQGEQHMDAPRDRTGHVGFASGE